MTTAYFVVRAVVPEEARRAFDDWYRTDHLPWAMRLFGAQKGWRVWSETDPSVHQAIYRFADRGALERAINSEGMKELVADFDRAWPNVKRSREIFALAEEADGTRTR